MKENVVEKVEKWITILSSKISYSYCSELSFNVIPTKEVKKVRSVGCVECVNARFEDDLKFLVYVEE